jgi:hypothetical protein
MCDEAVNAICKNLKQNKLIEAIQSKIDNWIETYPGTYSFDTISKDYAIAYINSGLNWKDYFIYDPEDERNIKYHEGDYYDHLPSEIVLEKWHKDWYRKLNRKEGALCWVGSSQKEILEKKNIEIIVRTYNDYLPTLGGSPRIFHLTWGERWYTEAKPLTKDELLYIKYSGKDFSWEELQSVENFTPNSLARDFYPKSNLFGDHTALNLSKAIELIEKNISDLEVSYPEDEDNEKLKLLEVVYNKKMDLLRNKLDDLEISLIKYIQQNEQNISH